MPIACATTSWNSRPIRARSLGDGRQRPGVPVTFHGGGALLEGGFAIASDAEGEAARATPRRGR